MALVYQDARIWEGPSVHGCGSDRLNGVMMLIIIAPYSCLRGVGRCRVLPGCPGPWCGGRQGPGARGREGVLPGSGPGPPRRAPVPACTRARTATRARLPGERLLTLRQVVRCFLAMTPASRFCWRVIYPCHLFLFRPLKEFLQNRFHFLFIISTNK